MCVMSTATIPHDTQHLERQNFELRKLNRILRRQVEVLEEQNRVYRELHRFDSKSLRELISGRGRKRRQREVN